MRVGPPDPPGPGKDTEAMETALKRYYQAIAVPEAPTDRWLNAIRREGADRPHPRWPIRVAAVVGVVLLLAAGLRMAPRVAGIVYAMTRGTVLARIVAWAADPGLLKVAQDGGIPPLNVVTRGRGATIRVVGAYADPVRTVIVLKTRGGMPDLLGMTLTDQFGQALTPEGMAWRRGQGVIDFPALPAWVFWPGVRLTLTVEDLVRLPAWRTRPGPWQLTWVQASPGVGATVAVGATSRSHGLTVRLTHVTLAPSATALAFVVTDGRPGRAPAPGKGTTPVVLRRVGGPVMPWLTFAGGDGHWELTTVPLTPGRYVLRVNRLGDAAGPWVFRFTVPRRP
jgi:hypothetical protein